MPVTDVPSSDVKTLAKFRYHRNVCKHNCFRVLHRTYACLSVCRKYITQCLWVRSLLADACGCIAPARQPPASPKSSLHPVKQSCDADWKLCTEIWRWDKLYDSDPVADTLLYSARAFNCCLLFPEPTKWETHSAYTSSLGWRRFGPSASRSCTVCHRGHVTIRQTPSSCGGYHHRRGPSQSGCKRIGWTEII